MKIEEAKDVFVFMDQFLGKTKNVSLELLTKGSELAGALRQNLCAVVLGKDCEDAITLAKEYGADKIYVLSGEEYEHYSSKVYGDAVLQLCEKYHPNTFLLPATVNGRELGSMLAVHLHTGLTADCTALSVEEESGNVVWERPAFGGNLYARILCSETRPQMGTCRPGAFQKKKNPKNSEVIEEHFTLKENGFVEKILEIVENVEDKEGSLSEAEIIVSVGRGIRSKENIRLARELASVLHGTLACSRAVVDENWLPQTRQVGQTGTTVTPKIYFALGISGAVQHIAGMSGAKTIIAINNDETAPIFEVAHYGLVGDVLEILPILTKALEKRRT